MKFNFLFLITLGLGLTTTGTFAANREACGKLISKPSIIIVSAPSGAGKTTLLKMLTDEYPTLFSNNISTTTRVPRPGEVAGRDYHFISVSEFKKKVASDDFIEWAEVHGNYYGTSREQVNKILDSGHSVLLNIDIQGAAAVKKRIGKDVVSVFISPPDLKILGKRLHGRGTDSEEAIALRLKNAENEMKYQNEFDHIVVNDDLNQAYFDLKEVLFKKH